MPSVILLRLLVVPSSGGVGGNSHFSLGPLKIRGAHGLAWIKQLYWETYVSSIISDLNHAAPPLCHPIIQVLH